MPRSTVRIRSSSMLSGVAKAQERLIAAGIVGRRKESCGVKLVGGRKNGQLFGAVGRSVNKSWAPEELVNNQFFFYPTGIYASPMEFRLFCICLPHFASECKEGTNSIPASVSEYSTLGGISIYCLRTTSP